MEFHQLTGLAGVAKHENKTARRWGAHFEWPMVLVALWIPMQWYLEARNLISDRAINIGDWVVWVFFVTETMVMSMLVDDRWRYLRYNWMNLLIIVVGIPILWANTAIVGILRNLRLFLIFGLLLRVSRTVKAALALNRLASTLWFALLVVITGGVVISSLEPSIESPAEGLWWAWVTITTVGYGDYVPSSPEGRMFASFLILLGVGLFSMLTANISAFLIGRDSKREEKHLRRELDVIKRKLDTIEQEIRLQNQLDQQQWQELKKNQSEQNNK